MTHTTSRPYVKGKFIFIDDLKFLIKGVTYGTFKPNSAGHQFPEEAVIRYDFKSMSEWGFNTVRTYTIPPQYVLDLALQYNLKVMVGVAWEQHITFLDSEKTLTSIYKNVKSQIKSCAQHPAILCYSIGNEIPANIVRWYGSQKIEKFLKTLNKIVKEEDPKSLVTYVNYPTTEYLNLDFLDFYSFNVYLETEEKLSAYISRLHNLCSDLPLVLAEIGLDSLRNGEDSQADTLAWQSRIILGKGCAGMFAFAWTDEWWRGGNEILDWNFGLVDRNRIPKPALYSLSGNLKKIPNNTIHPFFSVVICSYNGSATIRECIEGVMKLDYPAFEIIVVNDGSTDGLLKIVEEYPVKIINTANNGLSNARNTGMINAKGDIIAYIDDDAFPDADWLNYLAYAFNTTQFAAVGGPNLVPPNDGFKAKAIGHAPGGPVHVLLTDDIAEHIPGCNMAIRKKALLQIGGFDPVFRTAGDDVDVCWRLQERGLQIGFHHTAIVWHHRRNSIKTYWKQQKGYGKAEALLENKWPHCYNTLGHYAWSGGVYGKANTMPIPFQKKKIFYGSWGRALFQSVYNASTLTIQSIPLMPEWLLLCGFLLIAALAGMVWTPMMVLFPVTLILLLILPIQAVLSAIHHTKRSAAGKRSIKFTILVALLHCIQPMARLYGRMSNGLTPWRRRGVTGRKILNVRKISNISLWSERWYSNEFWLDSMKKNLQQLGVSTKDGNDFDTWDLRSRTHPAIVSYSTILVEEHGAGKQLIRLRNRSAIHVLIKVTGWILIIVALYFLLAGKLVTASIIAIIILLVAIYVLQGLLVSNMTAISAFEKLQQSNEKEIIVVSNAYEYKKQISRKLENVLSEA